MKPEFSREIKITEAILDKKFEVSANDSELKALAERFKLHSINSVEATYIISKKDSIKGAYLLNCDLKAEVIKFVIKDTEEKLQLDENFDVILIDEANVKAHEEMLQDEDIEIIDPEDPSVDVGEIAAQYISLCVYM